MSIKLGSKKRGEIGKQCMDTRFILTQCHISKTEPENKEMGKGMKEEKESNQTKT